MLVVTADEMKRIDSYTINVLEIPSIVLMENAALKVIKNIDIERRDSFAVICGTGNNGGDGLACARGLLSLGKKVFTYIIGSEDEGTREFKTNLRSLRKLTDNVKYMNTIGDIQSLPDELENVNMIIDAIFGIGLDSEIKGMAQYVIDTINKSRIYTLSIDIPSGIHPNTGAIMGTCVDPSLTVCLSSMKKGLVKNSLISTDIVVEHIGIPPISYRKVLGDDYENRNFFNI